MATSSTNTESGRSWAGGTCRSDAAERAEASSVLLMLRLGGRDVDRHAREMRQLAAREALGNGARHGNAHQSVSGRFGGCHGACVTMS